ncbi:MAG: hypothetical protein HN564_00065, partial [Flavobacteriales bacterium]|nr:hypothetical protein [Flavobacteriales bacterium]
MDLNSSNSILNQPISQLQNIGPSAFSKIQKIVPSGTIKDLLLHIPANYHKLTISQELSEQHIGKLVICSVTILRHMRSTNSKIPYKIECTDGNILLYLIFFSRNTSYLNNIFSVNKSLVIKGKLQIFRNEFSFTHPEIMNQKMDKISDIDSVYRLTKDINNKYIQNLIALILDKSPVFPEWINSTHLKKYNFYSWNESLEKIHRPRGIGFQEIESSRRRLAYDELLSYQLTIRNSLNNENVGRSLPIHNSEIISFINNLSFQLTNCQKAS